MKKIINVFLAVVLVVMSISAFIIFANADIVVKVGDINNNGSIDALDYLLLKRSCLGTFALNDVQKLCGDCNRNGSIDSVDYLLLKRMYFGTLVLENPDIIISDTNPPESEGPTYEDDGYYDEIIKP